MLNIGVIDHEEMASKSKVQFLFNQNKSSENDEEEDKGSSKDNNNSGSKDSAKTNKPRLPTNFRLVSNIPVSDHEAYLYRILLQFLQKHQTSNVEGNDWLLKTYIFKVQNLFTHFIHQSTRAKKTSTNYQKIAKIKNINVLCMRLLEHFGIIEIFEDQNVIHEHLDKIQIYKEEFQKDPKGSTKQVSLALKNFTK